MMSGTLPIRAALLLLPKGKLANHRTSGRLPFLGLFPILGLVLLRPPEAKHSRERAGGLGERSLALDLLLSRWSSRNSCDAAIRHNLCWRRLCFLFPSKRQLAPKSASLDGCRCGRSAAPLTRLQQRLRAVSLGLVLLQLLDEVVARRFRLGRGQARETLPQLELGRLLLNRQPFGHRVPHLLPLGQRLVVRLFPALPEHADVARHKESFVIYLKLPLLLLSELAHMLLHARVRCLLGRKRLLLPDDDARTILANEIGNGHEWGHVDQRLTHDARVHTHRIAIVELSRARLEEHLLRLVEQLNHVPCLEQR
mmetsp:Transcript_56337/g.125709  ORF Transcript_56337/g.125709 Transcript_56337/m.125709 type:complete len:311 (-) Transcript_56337:3854-4786(-)